MLSATIVLATIIASAEGLRVPIPRRHLFALAASAPAMHLSAKSVSAAEVILGVPVAPLAEAAKPILDAGKVGGELEGVAGSAADRIRNEGVLKSTGKSVPLPLAAAVVVGAAGALAYFATGMGDKNLPEPPSAWLEQRNTPGARINPKDNLSPAAFSMDDALVEVEEAVPSSSNAAVPEPNEGGVQSWYDGGKRL